MLNNPDIQPGAMLNRWIVGIKLFQFELVQVPGRLHNGLDGLSQCAISPNDSVEEDDADDWLNKTMSFAIILMNSRPSWASRLNAPCSSTQSLSYLLYRPVPYRPKTHLLCSLFFEDEDIEGQDTPEIPCSEPAQHADDRLDAVQAILLDPLETTDLLEYIVKSLIQYASKFFFMDGKLMNQDIQGHHKVVTPREKCYSLISRVHEAVGHRAIFSTLSYLREHFWWPMLDEDVKWFVSTCHPCQAQQTCHLHLPPTIPNIPMLMPMVNKFWYLIQAHCTLSSWAKWHPLRKENEKTLGKFIFEDILCWWGGMVEIITNNGPTFIAAAGYICEKYGIHHVKIYPYNSQANGVVK